MIDIWWHGAPAWALRPGADATPLPLLVEPEFGHERLDTDALPQWCRPAPRPEAVVAHCASDEPLRYHVVPGDTDAPPWPGKPISANAPVDVHVPPGMVLVFGAP